MKTLSRLAWLGLTLGTCLAVSAPTIGNISRGNIGAAANVYLDHYSDRNDAYQLNVSGSYFFWDHISLGLTTDTHNGSNNSTVSMLGPNARYFFWEEGRLAAAIHGSALLGLTDATVRAGLSAGMTLDVFLVPAVALGPYLNFTHYFGRNYPDYNQLAIGAQFGIFL